jgi:hypothetical protein
MRSGKAVIVDEDWRPCLDDTVDVDAGATDRDRVAAREDAGFDEYER